MLQTSLLALVLLSGTATDIPLGSFGYAMEINPAPDSAVVELPLPREVYEHVADPKIADLRLWNSAGERLPFELAVPKRPEAIRATVPLAIFPIPLESRDESGQFNIEIQRDGDTIIRVKTANGAPGTDGPSEKIAAYLIDTKSLTGKALDALTFVFSGDQDFIASYTLQSSNDLASWDTLQSNAAIARVTRENSVLERKSLDLHGTSAQRYLRLVAPAGSALPEISSIDATLWETRSAEDPVTVSVAPRRADKTGVYEWSSGGPFPFRSFSISNLPSNTLVKVELAARTDADQPFRVVAQGELYRWVVSDVELASPALRFPPTVAGQFRLTIDDKTPLGTSPSASLTYLPHELSFPNSGGAPFTMSFGHGNAAAVHTPLSTPAGATRRAALSVSPMRVLAGDSALSATKQLSGSTVALWLILVGAVALLAFIAIRLARQLDEKRSDGAGV